MYASLPNEVLLQDKSSIYDIQFFLTGLFTYQLNDIVSKYMLIMGIIFNNSFL